MRMASAHTATDHLNCLCRMSQNAHLLQQLNSTQITAPCSASRKLLVLVHSRFVWTALDVSCQFHHRHWGFGSAWLSSWLLRCSQFSAWVFPPMDHGQALMLQWIIYSNQLKDGTTHPRLGTGSRKFPKKTSNMGHVQWGEELRSQYAGPPKIFWTHTSPSSRPSLRALMILMAGARFAGYCFVKLESHLVSGW